MGGPLRTFRSLRSPFSLPAPAPVAVSSPTATTIAVDFDLALQTFSQPAGAELVAAVANRPPFTHRLLMPGAGWSVNSILPTRLGISNLLAPVSVLPGRVAYDPSLGEVLIGTNGVAVAAFDLPVPWP